MARLVAAHAQPGHGRLLLLRVACLLLELLGLLLHVACLLLELLGWLRVVARLLLGLHVA